MYTEQYWESANLCWWLKGYGYKLTYHRCFFSVGHLNIAWKSNSVIRSCSANKYLHQIKLFIILEHLDLTVTSRHFCGCFWLKETVSNSRTFTTWFGHVCHSVLPYILYWSSEDMFMAILKQCRVKLMQPSNSPTAMNLVFLLILRTVNMQWEGYYWQILNCCYSCANVSSWLCSVCKN